MAERPKREHRGLSKWGGQDNFGWAYANNLFAPSGSYLHDQDTTMDWLYKLRAVIGAAMLVVIGIHYHQQTKTITGAFSPVLGGTGGITGQLALGLLFVAPATGAVVWYTKEGSREAAFNQMMRYPVKTALICLGAYWGSHVFDQIFRPLVATNSFPIEIAVTLLGLVLLRYFLLFFRGIYLVTVGICRMGDGHPLLPPVVGSIITVWVAIQSFLANSAGAGEPSRVWLGTLIGGPVTVILLGCIEIRRLRNWHPDDFPFREGPLPVPGSQNPQELNGQQAN